MKQLFKPEDIERKVLLIMKILHESPEPLGALVIARKMSERDVQLSERTVRYHLKIMYERGLTRLVGRQDGRIITGFFEETGRQLARRGGKGRKNTR